MHSLCSKRNKAPAPAVPATPPEVVSVGQCAAGICGGGGCPLGQEAVEAEQAFAAGFSQQALVFQGCPGAGGTRVKQEGEEEGRQQEEVTAMRYFGVGVP